MNTLPSPFGRTREAGFTLVEFLVALIIGLLVLLAAVASLMGTRSTALTNNDVNALNQASILAFRVLGQQIRQAGYFPIEPLSPGAYFDTTAGRDTKLTDEPSFFAIKGNEAAKDEVNDTLKVGYAPASDYFRDCLGQTAKSGSTVYDPSDPANSANVRLITSEFAVSEGVLRCTGSGGDKAQPLVDGVERFDVRYGISATSEANQVVRYVSASTNLDFAQVRTVRVCLQLVGASKSNPSGTHTDCDGKAQTSNDGRLRRAYTAVFALRNL